jgi:hypothetical protein
MPAGQQDRSKRRLVAVLASDVAGDPRRGDPFRPDLRLMAETDPEHRELLFCGLRLVAGETISGEPT